jgi:2-polyprenyl-3-methyl-5-hydroxy-6-metoxy-1,4-benzoquinol methylase
MDLRELPNCTFARHPWETVRGDFFLRVLRDHLAGRELAALDLGAGDGYFARRLRTELGPVAHVTCFDTGYGATWMAAQAEPGLDFVADPPAGPFDLVILLDVLEHADDDAALLTRATGLVPPGGLVLLSVPAHPPLYSHHDRLLGHRRRYSPAQLRALAARAGLTALTGGQLFASLLLPRAVAKLAEFAATPRSGDAPAHVETALGTWHHGAMVTRVVTGLLALDAAAGHWTARRRWPWAGLSTWLLGRRR